MSININSPKKSKLKLNKALHLGNYTPNDLFRRYITIDEMGLEKVLRGKF